MLLNYLHSHCYPKLTEKKTDVQRTLSDSRLIYYSVFSLPNMDSVPYFLPSGGDEWLARGCGCLSDRTRRDCTLGPDTTHHLLHR